MVTGADFETLKGINPVGRVPVLELDDGTRLTEAYAIGDWLDETSPNGVRMLPESGEARRTAYQRLAIASGTADKGVALAYERNRRPEEFHWMEWQQRLVGQIQSGLADIDATVGDWSSSPDAGDVAAVIAYQFVEATNPWVLEPGYPRLKAFTEAAMSMPVIAETKPTV